MKALPWHQPTLDRLQAMRDTGQLPHALALTLAPGWGAGSLGEHAARAMLDLPVDAPIVEVAHPDFRWIEPERGMLKVDQIRELSEFAYGTPQIAPLKVAVLLDAHALNAQAANALLKTLEEPPARTHLLLVTEYFTRLMPTVRSRCQVLHSAPDAELARHFLGEQGVVLDEAVYDEFGRAPLNVLAASEPDRASLAPWLAEVAKGRFEVSKALLERPDLLLDRWCRLCTGKVAEALKSDNLSAALGLIEFQDELVDVRRQVVTTASANVGLALDRLMHLWMKLARRADL